jgi:hypothetical protein
MTPKRLV